MKKYIYFLLVIVLSSFLCSINCFADGIPTFLVTDSIIKPDDVAEVKILIRDNPGIVAYKLLVEYDSTKLTLVNAREGDFEQVAFGNTSVAPFSLLWSDALNENNTTNGTIAILSFRIKDKAKTGNYELSISYEKDDVFDYDLNNVHFNTVSGKITVLGNSTVTDSSSKEEDSSSEIRVSDSELDSSSLAEKDCKREPSSSDETISRQSDITVDSTLSTEDEGTEIHNNNSGVDRGSDSIVKNDNSSLNNVSTEAIESKDNSVTTSTTSDTLPKENKTNTELDTFTNEENSNDISSNNSDYKDNLVKENKNGNRGGIVVGIFIVCSIIGVMVVSAKRKK